MNYQISYPPTACLTSIEKCRSQILILSLATCLLCLPVHLPYFDFLSMFGSILTKLTEFLLNLNVYVTVEYTGHGTIFIHVYGTLPYTGLLFLASMVDPALDRFLIMT